MPDLVVASSRVRIGIRGSAGDTGRHVECVMLTRVMQPGVPPTWPELAERLEARTGHRLLLRAPAEAFSDGPQDVEVHLDGEMLGQFEFWWDDAEPDRALADLEYALSQYLDEPLKREDW